HQRAGIQPQRLYLGRPRLPPASATGDQRLLLDEPRRPGRRGKEL
ncbi:maltoporin, partial [Klebsiella pneumoniae]